MRLKEQKKEGFTIILITGIDNGQLDISNLKQLKQKFFRLVEKKIDKIAINLKDVKYIDSSTVGFFVDAFNVLRNSNGKFALLNVDKKIIEILDMTNLTKFLPIYNEKEFFQRVKNNEI